MDLHIRQRFSDPILADAALRYAIVPGSIRLLDGFESFMFEYSRPDTAGGGEGILRLSHSLRRTPALIQAEADWINYLAAGGAGVAQAWFSQQNQLVEPVDDRQGGQFLATAFAKAPGAHPDKTMWQPALFETYGQLIGRMHALSQGYTPPHAGCVRPQWDDPDNLNILDRLPPGSERIAAHYRALLALLRSLPKGADSYGMIHQDAHSGNFFVDEAGRITLFDFDDCCYGWFTYDLAMVIFYAFANRTDDLSLVDAFLAPFFAGYRRENRLDPAWLETIPHFLKLREIDLYAALQTSQEAGPWAQRFLAGRKERIETNQPFMDYDFRVAAAYL